MPRYLDPKADIVFKKIFSNHPQLLISFLNALLPLSPAAPIVSLSYLQSEQTPATLAFKHTLADVKCTDIAGSDFIVQMQINWTDYFKECLLFGTSQPFINQLEKGKEHQPLLPIYGLGIATKIYEKTTSQWYHHYQLAKKGDEHNDVITDLQLILIELPKFPIDSPEEEKLRLLWLRFLREIDEQTTTVPEELLAVPEIAKAIQLAEKAAYTPNELTLYESYWDQVSREKTLILDKYTEEKA